MEQTPSCKYFRLLADQYIEGELTGEEMREFEAHIAECPECRKEFEELRALKEMLAETDEDVPEGLHDKIMNAVKSEIKPRESRFRLLRRAAISAACAVICLSLTVAFALMPLWRKSTESGLPDDPIANPSTGMCDIAVETDFSAEVITTTSEAIAPPEREETDAQPEDISPDETTEATYPTDESTAGGKIPDTQPETAKPSTEAEAEDTAIPAPTETENITYSAAESTEGVKVPDTQPETAKPETQVAATEAETPSEAATEAVQDETDIITSGAHDGDTTLIPFPEANSAPGGEEITYALLIVSGLLAVASFIAFLISLSSVRNTPSKKNGESK